MKLRLHTRVGLGLLATGLTLLACTEAPHSDRGSTEAPLRLPTEREYQTCAENSMRGDGPASGDCNAVPNGPIAEDDPWGRFDCRTMGNLACTSTGSLDFELLDRPGCFMEPANGLTGWTVVRYSNIRGRGAPEFLGDPLGFEVPCPPS